MHTFVRALLSLLPLVATTAALELGAPREARACASFYAREAQPPKILREEALIVWDEAKKVEHFVRRAVFDTQVKRFGFVVPTPARPELAEAGAELFESLKRITKPQERSETHWITEPGSACLSPFERGMKKASVEAVAAGVAAPVRVLEEKRVAGMDATVIAATDADALAKWLGERGFDMRPAAVEWLKPYVAAGYTLTAFQYSRPDVASNAPVAGESVAPSAVRLSFPATKGFYPYREPPDAPEVFNRELHLFYVHNARTEGVLGAVGAPWSTTKTLFAKPVDLAGLGAALPGLSLASNAWLTELVDSASMRVREDVFFEVAADKSPVTPPPIIHVNHEHLFIPVDLLLFAGVGAYFVVRRVQRRKQAQ